MSVELAPSTSHILLLPPSPSTFSGPRRPLLPPPGFALPKLPPLSHDAALLGSGLRTPPTDDMSTTYHQAPAAYDSHSLHSYPAAIAHASRSKAAAAAAAAAVGSNDQRNNAQYYRYPPQQSQSIQATTSQTRVNSSSTTQLVSNASDRSTQSLTPVSETTLNPFQDATSSRRSSETLIYHSLQIPKCISSNGGNLADFAAQMTCLFWFESIDELKRAETIRSRPPNAPIPRLPSLAKPHEQFRKWVYNVLSTTQVTQNVILLALLFIYRLKMSTPQIKGRGGSEYRLLTVALMLGNKFLDDNTYTNKTWAEVSCFNVQEIHVMEVEFLSNMRYNLLASKTEWEDWLVKLACFHEYYERALRLPASPIHISSPSGKSFHSPIPSPTATSMPGPLEMPPFTPTATTNFSPSSSHSQNWSAYHNNPVSPLAAKPTINLPLSRKRSSEDDPIEHPAKRHMPPRLGQVTSAGTMNARPNGIVDSSRLPVPHLTIVTSQGPSQAATYTTPNVFTPQSSTATPSTLVSLPPLQPGMRAMSTVYHSAPTSALHQPTVTTAAVPTMSATGYPVATLPSHPSINYSTPNKHHNPATLAPYTSSPMAEPHFGGGSGVHTPMVHTPLSHSPSVYLQQRASPYKPIRHVNRLLYPPPSASLDQYHLAVPVQPTQMHYQPLGRRNDLRTGVVPEFVVYNRGQHLQHLQTQGQFAP